MKAELVLQNYTSAMVERMEKMKGETWHCGWTSSACGSLPMNISKREYNGFNSFFLQLFTDVNGWEMPVFATIKQINEFGGRVNKGEKSTPVIYWDIIHVMGGKRISESKYESLNPVDREMCEKIPFIRSYNVFNIGQTNMKDAAPDIYDGLQSFYIPESKTDTSGMYSSSKLDKMLSGQEWHCKINYKDSSPRAFYDKTNDRITVPKKEQFRRGDVAEDVYKSGMEFYNTLLHEMIHSTGHATRLGRLESCKFGDKKYAKEELVAELGASLIGGALGFDSKLLDNNAAYLDNWIKAMKEEQKFIVSVFSDVNKACKMVFDVINI